MKHFTTTILGLTLIIAGCGEKGQGLSTINVTNGAPIGNQEYPAVVKINVGGGSCTASFVADDTLLTAAHCVYGKSIGGDVRVFVHPLYAASGRANRVDLALLKFSKKATSEILAIAATPAQVNDPITIVGFGLDDVENPYSGGAKRVGTNRLQDRSGGLLVFSGLVRGSNTGANSASASGDSGGPMLVAGKQVGVTSAGSVKGNTKFSFYVDLHSRDSKDFFKQAEAAGITLPLPANFF